MEGVRLGDVKYAMSYDELEEYSKCKYSIEYFTERYCKFNLNGKISNIKLRDYQQKVLKDFTEKRFNIWMSSRQMGTTNIKIIFFLHSMIFNTNFNILSFEHKLMENMEILERFRSIYEHLPYFLKPGVLEYNTNKILFDNGSEISFLDKKKMDIIKKELEYKKKSKGSYHNIEECDLLSYGEISRLDDQEFTNIFTNVLPNLKNNGRVIITSRLNGNNKLYEMVINSEKGKGTFNIIKTYWWEISSRDMKWREEMIKSIGEEFFNREYELSFVPKK